MSQPIVRMNDMTFGRYNCKKKAKKKPAMGVIITPGNSMSLADNLLIGGGGICLAAQPACIKVPINISIVGSPVSIGENKGITRLNDPVLGVGVPGYTGMGIYMSGSPDAMAG